MFNDPAQQMVQAYVFIAWFICVQIGLTMALPVDTNAVEPVLDQSSNVYAILQAASDKLRIHPNYNAVRPALSDSLSSHTAWSTGASSSAHDATGRFVAKSEYVWQSSRSSGRLSVSPPPRKTLADYLALNPTTGRRLAATDSQLGPPLAKKVNRAWSVAVSVRNLLRSTLERIKSTFRIKSTTTPHVGVDQDATPEATQALPARGSESAPSSKPHLSTVSSEGTEVFLRSDSPPSSRPFGDGWYYTTVNQRHPYFGPESHLRVEEADTVPYADLPRASLRERPKPAGQNIPTSFVKMDANLARIAERLPPLRVYKHQEEMVPAGSLNDIPDLYFKRKGNVLPRLKSSRETVPAEVSKPPSSLDQLESMSATFFTRTGRALPSVELPPPKTELYPLVDLPYRSPSLYRLRSGKPIPTMRIPVSTLPATVPQRDAEAMRLAKERTQRGVWGKTLINKVKALWKESKRTFPVQSTPSSGSATPVTIL